jgi:hypothetical protein
MAIKRLVFRGDYEDLCQQMMEFELQNNPNAESVMEHIKLNFLPAIFPFDLAVLFVPLNLIITVGDPIELHYKNNMIVFKDAIFDCSQLIPLK